MKLKKVLEVLNFWYPSYLTEEWDKVGLLVGEPTQNVNRILLTIDTTSEVVNYAIDHNFDLIISHHPLLLKPIHSVAAVDNRGKILTRLIKADCALYAAHTNADKSLPGVSDALAEELNLTDLKPIVPVHYPNNQETRLGLGRVGKLNNSLTPLGFVKYLKGRLKLSGAGLRFAGNLVKPIKTVAVCGGAGDSLLTKVAELAVDAYVTADLRHHPVDEFIRAGGNFLVDIGHWSSEFPWCHQLQKRLIAELSLEEIAIYASPTDHWHAEEYS